METIEETSMRCLSENTVYEIGNEVIDNEYLTKMTKLKREKQTYGVNKFVLQNVISELDNLVIS